MLATQAARGEVRVKSTVSRSPSSPLLTCGPLKLDLHQAGKLPCSVPKASAPNMMSFFLPNSCSQQQPWVLRPPGTCLCWWASSLSGLRTCSLGMGSYKWWWGSQITHQKVKWAMWGSDQGTAPKAHHPAGMPLYVLAHCLKVDQKYRSNLMLSWWRYKVFAFKSLRRMLGNKHSKCLSERILDQQSKDPHVAVGSL